jgi:biotin transport system substrate-specific component
LSSAIVTGAVSPYTSGDLEPIFRGSSNVIRSSGNALAVSVWPSSVNRVVRDVVLIVVGSILLAISAKVKVWMEPVPITLQTFTVMVLAAAYGSRLAVLTVLAYLAEGCFGLPVFTNTPPAIAGPAYFLGTTGGFLVGFLPQAWIVGKAADWGWDRSIVKLGAALTVSNVVVFALGLAWLAWFAALASGAHGIGLDRAFAAGVAPFIVSTIVKIALAACAVPAVWRLIGRR